MLANPQEERNWKLRSSGQRSEQEVIALIESLEKETGLSPLTLRVCILRGFDSRESIQEYLTPRFEKITSPTQLKDMDIAVARLSQARRDGQKVRIFGDYDVDGTTGAALLSWVFKDFGFIFDARQPDRFKDGYGLNVRAVEQAVEDGVQLLVTVDCGITSFEAAKKAAALGLDLIVVDHHQLDPVQGLPQALAVINPQRKDCESGLRQLCGCGLAFYLSVALRMHGRSEGWFAGLKSEPNLKQHLDLVVMATAADMVPLTGDNHILVRYGLDVLKGTKKPGVRALLEKAGIGSKDVSPSHLGFVIGPRINASGRMHSASLALELLTTEDELRANELAQELERLNQERADLQNHIWDQVRLRVEQGLAEGKYQHGIVVADSSWHEGVVGIVASRVTETFRKPAAVIAMREGVGKGSVRSFGGKDILSALRQCAPLLLGFGGHKHAAGLSVSVDQIGNLEQQFDQALEHIREEGSGGVLFVEGSCSLEELNVQSLQELERLGPFGPGNPEPTFMIQAAARQQRVLKGRHLKMTLQGAGRAALDAIWFHGAERKDVQDEKWLDEVREWAGVPELNRFRGQLTPSFRVRDWRKVEA